MTKKLKISVAKEIESLVAYPPGKPRKELERELGVSESIKLASNENPLGPSRLAIEAIASELSELNRYPDGSCFYLREALASSLNVSGNSLIFGNGSNEIIELLVRTFVNPGENVVMGDPSFAVYPIITQAGRGESRKVPLNCLSIDLKAMACAIDDKTRLVFISNPNNPTGTIVGKAELKEFIDNIPDNVIICMDEAYYEYVTSPDYPDCIEFVREGSPVIVLRTFSKVYGLAGLRIGYGIADPEIIGYMDRVRQPFNVNSLAQAAALAALKDTAHIEATLEINKEGIEYLFTELKDMDMECVSTEANFFLVKVGDGKGLYQSLLKQGVIVRPMDNFGLPEYIRVTIGTMDENKRFITTLRSLYGEGSDVASRA